mgnify:CR=1 FL=1
MKIKIQKEKLTKENIKEGVSVFINKITSSDMNYSSDSTMENMVNGRYLIHEVEEDTYDQEPKECPYRILIKHPKSERIYSWSPQDLLIIKVKKQNIRMKFDTKNLVR